MGSEPANGVFGYLGEEQTADGPQGVVAKVSVQLDGNPGRSALQDRLLSEAKKKVDL